MRKQELFRHVLDYFRQTMDDTETELNYSNPFELLVAVVLSAQCTDKRINMVTPALFAAYPTPADMGQRVWTTYSLIFVPSVIPTTRLVIFRDLPKSL